MAHTIQRHPELVSGSVSGERQEKARGEMLKQVQHDVTTKRQTWRLKDAKPKVDSPRVHVRGNERRQTWRLKDAKPKANSRGLLSPWKQKRRIENGVCEDAERQRIRGLKATKPHNHPSSRRLTYTTPHPPSS